MCDDMEALAMKQFTGKQVNGKPVLMSTYIGAGTCRHRYLLWPNVCNSNKLAHFC